MQDMDKMRIILREILASQEITQKALARRSHVSESTIGKFLSGKRPNISSSTVMAIARSLDMPVEILQGSRMRLEHEVNFIYDTLKNFDTDERRKILKIIKDIISIFDAQREKSKERKSPEGTRQETGSL